MHFGSLQCIMYYHVPGIPKKVLLRYFSLMVLFASEVSFFFQYFTLPNILKMYEYPIHTDWLQIVSNTFEFLILALYYCFWMIPIYLISFIINNSWLQRISQDSFLILKKQKAPTPTRNIWQLPKEMATEIYTTTFYGMFLFQSFLSYLIPFFGPILNLVFLCWLYSLYCFEYRWSDWNLGKRLRYIEDNWAYFVGFGMVAGTPFTLASFYCGFWISSAVWWLAFPFFIITAIGAKKPPHRIISNGEKSTFRLFRVAKALNTVTLTLLVKIYQLIT